MPSQFELAIVRDADALAQLAAKRIAQLIRAKPEAIIIPATGNTPVATYRALARICAEDRLGTSRIRIFQLDDYVGIADADPRSLYAWMKRVFLDPLKIHPAQVTRLVQPGEMPQDGCARFDRALADAGGADLAILGLGANGHLGYNEPGAAADSPARVLELTPESVAGAKAYFAGEIPRHGVTAGMNALLGSQRILLLVSGREKREILRRSMFGPMTPDVPASFLQRLSHATVIADHDALGFAR